MRMRGARTVFFNDQPSQRNTWHEVKLADGREAWVASSAVDPNPWTRAAS